MEWATALTLGVDLPDCESFPSEQASCPDQSGSGSGSGSSKCGSIFTCNQTMCVLIFHSAVPLPPCAKKCAACMIIIMAIIVS